MHDSCYSQGRREGGGGGGGGASCPGPPTWEGPLKKRDLIRLLDFAQKRSQNAGNAISKTLNSKFFRGNGPGAP